MSARTRLDADVRREQILDAAREHFWTRPQNEVSLDAIAEQLGVTRALINHHFGSKRGLYVAVVRRVLDSDLMRVPEYVHGATLEQRLGETIDRMLDEIGRDPELWTAAMRAGDIGDNEIYDLAEAARERATANLVATLGLGPMSSIEPRHLALMRGLVGFGETLVLQHFEYDRLTRAELRELIVTAGLWSANEIFAARRAA